jgi:pyruvate dehydrogenase phosphatase
VRETCVNGEGVVVIFGSLHMACTGDSRAVMGIYEPASNANEVGKWRAVVLTDDQTGRNPQEVKRCVGRSVSVSIASDPTGCNRSIRRARKIASSLAGESSAVSSRHVSLSLVTGGDPVHAPAGAFGDARYKWAHGLQERLQRAFLPEGGRGPPPR